MKLRHLFLNIIAAAGLILIGFSQSASAAAYDDYDDDIYYNADKAKAKAQQKAAEEAAKAKATQAKASSTGTAYVPNIVIDYDDPAIYNIEGSGLNVDVDTYNRHGSFMVSDTTAASTAADADTYAYTRRIERFYNEDVVNGSNDQALIDSYYSTPATSDINIYVVNASPWNYYGSWYNSWYYPWSWSPWYWNSWYTPGWSFGWGWYDPWYSWSWNWGWGPSWGWNGPGWGPPPPPGGGFRPGGGPIGRPGGNWAVNAPGASRPHNPVSTGSSSTNSRRPGAFSAGANTALTRPGNSGRPSTGSAQMTGTATVGTRPTMQGTVNTVNTNRGRGNNNASTPAVRQSSSQTRSSNSSTVRSSVGSRSTHSSGGSTHSTGGGGGASRGRR